MVIALNDSDLQMEELADPTKNFVKDAGSEAKEIILLIDNLPVIIFRVSTESSWSIHYISKNVEKFIGYSTTDFISQRLS